MSFSDETLIAYADGELDEVTRLAVESAMRHDSSLTRRVARLRAARDEGVYADQHNPSAMRARQGANVVQLATVRAQRLAQQQALRRAATRRHWGWLEWSALALVMVLGLAAGKFGLAKWQPGWFGDSTPPPTEVISRNGLLLAQGRLAASLSQQLGGAAAQADNDVRVGLSFLSNEGTYCRSFTLVGITQDLVGLACRANDEWRVPVLAQNARPLATMGAHRMAGTEMPTAVLEAIDQRIVGGMLDTRAELEALRRNWQR
ncbi:MULTISPECIES: hypothetical protein [unclassified Duganella]|uniref:hypothetical protein n=1 Tax=unclassified Duganella TaxID=2636909 RepID=UPI00088CECD9|nr:MULTISPECIES: hypothetical protein [unclassified Duganella]SDH03223.1 hypothetical protein SAMN05216320_10957 [Duganella sp. OV458]SDK22864.1 hypothetical protein SAMN05428973_109225 [Duganella sp. OV510]